MTQHNTSNNTSHQSDELDWLYDPEVWDYIVKQVQAERVYIWILSLVEVPIMILTLFALCFLIKSRRVASVFVIHLILSDLIQIICLILGTIKGSYCGGAYEYSLTVGVYFMACIAFERYLLVSHPIWHRTHQSLKSTCLISVIIWFVPLIFAKIKPPHLFLPSFRKSIAFFIPYPIIILCFVGTWRGLSLSISLTALKRKMILGSLFLVLLSYTFLILPIAITDVFTYITDYKYGLTMIYQRISMFANYLLYLNPLADCLLYLFMRSDAADIMPSIHCCCRSPDTHQISVPYTNSTNTYNTSSCTVD